MRFDYLEPTAIEEAVALLDKYNGKAKVIAGGTDLWPQMRNKVVMPEYVVDIGCIPGLDYIDYDEEQGLKIGALTTLRAIEKSGKIRELYPIISQAVGVVGSVAIRNMGTIGGNLCQDTKCLEYAQIHTYGLASCYRSGGDVCHAVRGAKRCSAMAIPDTAPSLICMDANVRIVGPGGERTCFLEDFFVSSGVVDLRPNEILTAIEVPHLPPNTDGIYLKHSLGDSVDFSIASVAVVLTRDDGICKDARICLLGVARVPMRARKSEEILKGERVDESSIDRCAQMASQEARPVAECGITAADKRQMIRTLTEEAIRKILAK